MDQKSAERALLGVVREDNHHQHQQSSGSTLLEENAALATFGAAMQQLVSQTAATRPDTSDSADTPTELARVAASTTPVISRGIGTAPMDNRQQCIKFTGPYEFRCEVLDNRRGSIIIDGPLTIYCAQLNSGNGIITATGPITILCTEFDNYEGQIKSREGTLTITSRYALRNQRGMLMAKSTITLTNPQQLIDNAQGSITTEGRVSIASGSLENSGQINGKTITVASHTLKNHGQMAGEQISIGVVDFQNCPAAGQDSDHPTEIRASRHLAIGATTLHNLQQARLLSNDSLVIGALLDDQLQVQGTLSVLDNFGSTIAANGAARLQVSSFNSDATSILQGGQLILESNTLQGSGAISAVLGDLQVSVNSEQPVKLEAALQANGSVRLTAPGELSIHSSVQAGTQRTVTAHVIHNQAEGSMRANGETQIVVGKAAGGCLNNRGVIDGSTTEVRGHSLNNLGSGAISGNQLLLEADTVINDGGGAGEQRRATLSARQGLITIAAQQLRNVGGASIISQGSLAVGGALDEQRQLVGPTRLLDNQGSRISARSQAIITTVTFNHDNASTLWGGEQVTLESDTLTGGGSITSAGTLAVHLRAQQPVAIRGPLRAGKLTVTAVGELNNHNSWEADEQATVRCQFLRNHAEGSIRSEGQTQIVVGAAEGGRLNNRGLIDGATTEIRGHSLNNLGRGVIYGNHLLFGAETLTNNREAVNGQTKALIIGRQSLKIGAQQVCNREGALIMSAGEMAVGARLDEQQQLIGQMPSLDNHSATIEVQGAAHFQLRKLHNLDIHFGVEYRHTSEPVVEYVGDFRTCGHNLGWQSRTWLESQLTPLPPGTPVPGYGSPLDLGSIGSIGGVLALLGGGVLAPLGGGGHHYLREVFRAPDGSCLVNYVIRRYTRYTSQPGLAASCRPSKVHIGGNFYLDGELLNENSHVVLNGKMIGPTQDVRLEETYSTRGIAEVGSQLSHWYARAERKRDTGDSRPYHHTREERVPLRAAVEQRNVPLPVSGVALAPLGILALPGDTGEQQALQPWSPSANVQQVAVLARRSEHGAAIVVRSSLSPLRLPEVGLFTVQLAGTGPVVVTEPSFRCREDESGTALLLRELHLGNSALLPRLHGGSFYERLRIRQQVIQLTAQYLLPGFHSETQQQQVLFARGLAAAARLQLIPGVPLTTTQQLQL